MNDLVKDSLGLLGVEPERSYSDGHISNSPARKAAPIGTSISKSASQWLSSRGSTNPTNTNQVCLKN
ncbi:MAG TPA: hypothetical protein EYO58_01325 [Flavobacteriales bacterium]|nr:hypothetical protein [Flavobacteriales bacterium]